MKPETYILRHLRTHPVRDWSGLAYIKKFKTLYLYFIVEETKTVEIIKSTTKQSRYEQMHDLFDFEDPDSTGGYNDYDFQFTHKDKEINSIGVFYKYNKLVGIAGDYFVM